jgi:hypothetical protein
MVINGFTSWFFYQDVNSTILRMISCHYMLGKARRQCIEMMPGLLNACAFEMLPEDVPSLSWGLNLGPHNNRSLLYNNYLSLFLGDGLKPMKFIGNRHFSGSRWWIDPNLGQGASLVRRWGIEKAHL